MAFLIPIVLFLLALAGAITFDAALAGIGIVFIVALLPGIVENFRKKIGWNRTTTAMTASGLLSMGTMFLMLGLTLTGATTVMSGLAWSVLTFQAYRYGGGK